MSETEAATFSTPLNFASYAIKKASFSAHLEVRKWLISSNWSIINRAKLSQHEYHINVGVDIGKFSHLISKNWEHLLMLWIPMSTCHM